MNAEQIEATLVNLKEDITFVTFVINGGATFTLGGKLTITIFAELDGRDIIQYRIASGKMTVDFTVDSINKMERTKNGAGIDCWQIYLKRDKTLQPQ